MHVLAVYNSISAAEKFTVLKVLPEQVRDMPLSFRRVIDPEVWSMVPDLFREGDLR